MPCKFDCGRVRSGVKETAGAIGALTNQEKQRSEHRMTSVGGAGSPFSTGPACCAHPPFCG
jgi:hypothetical protein